MKIARISWRSLWRNSIRTNVTITAVALCIAILIIFQSLIIGLIGKAVYNTTNLVVGEVQIHATGYLDDRSIYKSLKNIEKIRAVAKENNIGMVERSYGFGLISSGTKSAGTQFWGVDPVSELKYFDFANHIDEGKFFNKNIFKEGCAGAKISSFTSCRSGN